MSMGEERLTFRGWLLQQEEKVKELRLKLKGLQESMRGGLSLLRDVKEIDGELLAQRAVEFRAIQIDLAALEAEIAAKKRAFGEE